MTIQELQLTLLAITVTRLRCLMISLIMTDYNFAAILRNIQLNLQGQSFFGAISMVPTSSSNFIIPP